MFDLVDSPGDHTFESPIRRGTIRIPVHMIETITKLVRTSARHMLQKSAAKRGRRPEELAKARMPLAKVRQGAQMRRIR